MKFVVANFKSHQTNIEAREWMEVFKNGYLPREEMKVVLATSYTNIGIIREIGEIRGVAIGAQDVSPFPPGAYTGAINAKQLTDLGVKYTIVGHAERRKWFAETHREIANKIRGLLEQEITPILCLDRDYLEIQTVALEDEWMKELIVAYEPVAAIGSGQAEDPNEAGLMVEEIRAKMMETKAIIYGGSVSVGNAKKYLDPPAGKGFDGLLVGTGSLDPEKFLEIVNNV